MKKLLVMLLVLTMSFTLGGCKKKVEEVPTAPADEFEEDASQEEDAADTNTEEADPVHDPAVAEELKAVAPLYEGVIRALYQPDIAKDGLSYVPSDSQFYWMCIYFTANQLGDTVEGVTVDDSGSLIVPADIAAQYASGCFSSNQSLPEIPDEIAYVTKTEDNYVFASSDAGDTSMKLTKAYANADDTCTAIVEYSTSEGLLGTYEIIFEGNPTEGALFPYQVTDAKLVK